MPKTGNNSKSLTKAGVNKKDEFFTQLTDIEEEVKHYKEHFRGASVLCNCDDPSISNFFKYFMLNFEYLELKKLVGVCYKNSRYDMFSAFQDRYSVCLEYNGKNADQLIKQTVLTGDGDFRSEECKELLKQADIVVTNPPFSLFREYIAQLIKYKKKFLIIGNVNAVTYKEVFPLFKNNQVWFGASIHSGDREFEVPKDYPLYASGCRVDEATGRKFIRVKGVRWFTNLDYPQLHEDLILYKNYTPEEFPKYDEYDAINVNRTSDIPKDYNGIMGVPITFLDRYNPDQFEILGLDRYIADNPHLGRRFTLNGKETYARILIRRKH